MQITPEQNQELIDRISTGDERAYQNLFNQCYRELVISSYRILKDENLCRDAVQEVFMDLWKNRSNLHEGITLIAYLKRGVMNRSINIIKSRKHHMSSGAEPLMYLVDSERDPEQQFEDAEFKSYVMKAIDKMPERCRAIFMMKRVEGMSHNEIAEQLGISKKTIENQITKALKILREEIEYYRSLTLVLFFSLVVWGKLIFELLVP